MVATGCQNSSDCTESNCYGLFTEVRFGRKIPATTSKLLPRSRKVLIFHRQR
jgi:hypothetical protein